MPDEHTVVRRPDWLSPGEFPFRSRSLVVDGAALHYVDEGSGPVLLLLHGSPMWSFMYRRAISSLRARYRCIAVDLPGLGLSGAPLRPGHAYEDAARRLRAFVKHLDLRDAVLAVHATAGPPGLEMATQEPNRFSGLVISNTFAWPLEGDRRLAFFARIVSSRWFAWLNVTFNVLARVTAWKGRRDARFNEPERRAILGPYENRDTRRHLQNYLFGVRVERDRFSRLERNLSALAHLPTLLLYGAHDNGYRAGFLERWRSILPSSDVRVLENAGHFPFEDDPAATVEALSGWLESRRSPGHPEPEARYTGACPEPGHSTKLVGGELSG